MKSLHEYVQDNLIIPRNTEDSPILINSEANGLSELITNCFIEENAKKCALPDIKETTHLTHEFHNELVDVCILHLLQNNYLNNILTYGYQLAKNSDVIAKLFCRSTNTNISILKGNCWKLLHELIGSVNFMNILINASVYHYNGNHFRQLIGIPANAPQIKPTWCGPGAADTKLNECYIDWNNVLYRTCRQRDTQFILPSNSEDLLNEIFPNNNTAKFDSKRNYFYKHLKPLIRQAQLKHKKVPYRFIMESICPKTINYATSSKKIIHLIIVLVRKTLPAELFGSNKNYNILCKNIPILIKKPLHTRIPFRTLISGISITEISWLDKDKTGKEENKQIHLQDYKNRVQIFERFYFWLLSTYLPRLISSLFYVTEISASVDIIYIRQDVWKAMSTPFLKTYSKKYLIENKDCDDHKSFTNSKYNHRNLRVIPKKTVSDFRIIAIPCKGTSESELLDYTDYVKSALRPTKIILEQLRKKRKTRFCKLFSPLEIPVQISKFKSTLLSKNNGILPNLHALKFDIESCYDSIPVLKVLNIVKNELSHEKSFFIRSQEILSKHSTRLKRKHVINGDITFKENDLVIDSVKTTVLSFDDVMNVLQMELFKTSINYRGKCYLRKNGLHQGTPLSSVLVDILYDDLMEYYDEFICREDEHSLVLRLADDFLILSTSEKYVKTLHELAKTGFKEYAASVNPNKLLLTSSNQFKSEEIPFCALQINIKQLEVWKAENTYNVITTYEGSSKKLYAKLLWLFDMRLSYNTLDQRLNSWKTMLKHLRHASRNLAKTFVTLFADKIVTKEAFIEFMSNMFEKVDYYNSKNRDYTRQKSQECKMIIISTFYLFISTKRNKFPFTLDILKELSLIV